MKFHCHRVEAEMLSELLFGVMQQRHCGGIVVSRYSMYLAEGDPNRCEVEIHLREVEFVKQPPVKQPPVKIPLLVDIR